MGFTKMTGVDVDAVEIEIIKPDVVEEAKLSKTASSSLIDAVDNVENEDEEPNS